MPHRRRGGPTTRTPTTIRCSSSPRVSHVERQRALTLSSAVSMVAGVWRLDAAAPVPLWRHDGSAERGLGLAFSTRQGGVSLPPFDTLNLGRSTADRPLAVTENRRRML